MFIFPPAMFGAKFEQLREKKKAATILMLRIQSEYVRSKETVYDVQTFLNRIDQFVKAGACIDDGKNYRED